MGYLLFILFAIVVIGFLWFFKKHRPVNRVDKTAWDKSERTALEVLQDRLSTGDITQEEFDAKKKEIEINS